MLSAMPSEHLQRLIRKEVKLFPDLTIEAVTGTLDEVVAYARTTPLDIFEVILSRGGMAHALREVLPIPVISIQFSSSEIMSPEAPLCRGWARKHSAPGPIPVAGSAI